MKTITKKLSRMHNPPHPGEVLMELCIKPLGLTISEAAKALDVIPRRLSLILKGVAVTPEMAVRLSIAFNTTGDSWLMQQIQYDLWRAERQRDKLRVERLAA